MKKLLIAAAVVGLAGTANAQSAFEGAYGQIGIGYQSISPSLNTVTFDTSSGFATAIGIGYNFAIDKNFLLGIGADYNPVASSSANYRVGSTTDSYKSQNSYNIFLTPGYALSKDSLAYAKVGYSATTFKYNDGSPNDNLTGYMVGLGYKQIIDGGLYGFTEANYSSTSKNVDIGSLKSNSYNLLVGIGYKF